MPLMRAKMQVQSVTHYQGGNEEVKMTAVCGKHGLQGESEDNTYARYTPIGETRLVIANPDLYGKIKAGQKFYLDFTETTD